MTKPTNCLARQGADQQMHCARCGLVWDIDDPEPPTCSDKPAKSLKPAKPKKQRKERAK